MISNSKSVDISSIIKKQLKKLTEIFLKNYLFHVWKMTNIHKLEGETFPQMVLYDDNFDGALHKKRYDLNNQDSLKKKKYLIHISRIIFIN